jgi:hypothetical protein
MSDNVYINSKADMAVEELRDILHSGSDIFFLIVKVYMPTPRTIIFDALVFLSLTMS